ncbi:MAG: 50S ribosomal protein L1, partial [Cytophagales bacterium]|nr:50S ribosomal protein L1 [Cytophagales bacterium]
GLSQGTGKQVRVLVLCSDDKVQEAKDAGADHVGLDDYIQKIEQGWTDIDVIITMPTVMAKVGRLGRVLGPRGLMPNPKAGTVTLEVGKAVQEVKAGKIDFKVDKFGIIHASIGKASFTPEKLRENANELIQTLARLKPSSSKGTYFKSISLSSTMSPGLRIDKSSIGGI